MSNNPPSASKMPLADESSENDSTPQAARSGLHELLSHAEVNSWIVGKRSDFEGLKRLLIHFSFIASGIFFVSHSLSASFSFTSCLYFVFALLWLAYCISFLFHALHEAVHQTAFNSPILNSAVAHACAFLTFRFPYHYKLFHFSHHRWTGDPNRDPELQNSWLDPQIDNLPGYLLYLSGIMFWIDRSTLIIRHVLGIFLPSEFYIATRHYRQRITEEARRFVVAYVIVILLFWSAGRISNLWYYWLLPSIIGQVNLRFYLLSEHVGCQQNSSNMLLNTRTTSTIWLTRLLAWEMPYHTEHHAYPNVPFYLLSEIHKKISKKSISLSECIPNGANGYIESHLFLLKNIFKKSKSNQTVQHSETEKRD